MSISVEFSQVEKFYLLTIRQTIELIEVITKCVKNLLTKVQNFFVLSNFFLDIKV